jgi:hypothetical protein
LAGSAHFLGSGSRVKWDCTTVDGVEVSQELLLFLGCPNSLRNGDQRLSGQAKATFPSQPFREGHMPNASSTGGPAL